MNIDVTLKNEIILSHSKCLLANFSKGGVACTLISELWLDFDEFVTEIQPQICGDDSIP